MDESYEELLAKLKRIEADRWNPLRDEVLQEVQSQLRDIRIRTTEDNEVLF
jgi:hypothetical protein